jgi:hypothetical protein
MELLTASHDELIALIRQQQASIAALEQRIRELERERGTPRGMPGHKPGPAPARRVRQPRRPRQQQFTRPRSQPTRQVTHVVTHCPACGLALAGGSVKRTREVIEVEPTPVTVTEHVYLERCCPGCGRRHTPAAALTGVVLGQSRLGVRLVSLIATLREEARLPLRAIQRYLVSVHGLELSVGALVGALRQVARAGQPTVAALQAHVQASPVVHADETGWREAGHNGFIWTFSTPDSCYLTHGGRGKDMVDRVLDGADGVLVSDFYAAYDHYPGAQQKCWAHLLRDVHDVRLRDPANTAVTTWADAVQALYDRAVVAAQTLRSVPAEAPARQQVRHALMTELLARCQPWLTDETAPQAVLCRRIAKYQHTLFMFVLDPAVPTTNNAAERSLRHLVIARKISGGTRSAAGTATRLTLASLFGTWRLRGLNPYETCLHLIASPQP